MTEKLKGINVSAKVVPFTTDDIYATHVSTYGQGGWHEVLNDTEMYAIPSNRKIAGMAVYVTSEQKLYILNDDLETWTLFETGKIEDVKVNGESVVENKIANIDLTGKQDVLEAGNNITIAVDSETDKLTISATDTTYTQGTNVIIDDNNVISAIDTTYKAGENVSITKDPETDELVISAIDTTYKAGSGLTLNGTEFSANVIDSVTSTSTTDALSANQGKVLQEQIDNLKAIGRYLSNWKCTTGLPTTNPQTDEYTYHTGDYFYVSEVATVEGQKNYKPNGTKYIKDVPSTTEETQEIHVGDIYLFDGTSWILLSNTQKTVTFANIAGNPEDNLALKSALDSKVNNEDLGDATITFTKNSLTTIGSFTTNQKEPNTINLEIPEDAEHITYNHPDYSTVQEALDKLLYITPSVSISGGSIHEVGEKVSSVSLTWDWNKKTITSQTLKVENTLLPIELSDRDYSYNPRTPITKDTTFTISGSDGKKSASASTSVKFLNYKYWGTTISDTLTTEQLKTLSKELSGRGKDFDFDCTGGKYWWYALPTSLCTGIKFYDINSGQPAELTLPSDCIEVGRIILNFQEQEVSYNIYRGPYQYVGSSVKIRVI